MDLRIVFVIVVLGVMVEGKSFPFDNWAIFGDSLTDTGNAFAVQGFPFPPYYKGRFSNGPVWVEYLAPMLNFPAPVASNDGGVNYAYGGATSGFGESNDVCCSSTCCCTYNDGGDLHGLFSGNQTAVYLASHQPNSKTLIVIWIGANDIIQFYPTATSMANIAAELSLLISKGVKYFLLLNMPDLGLAPLYYNTTFQALATGAASFFNGALLTTISSIKANHTDVTFYTPNIFALSGDTPFVQERGVFNIGARVLIRVNETNPNSKIIISANASTIAWWDTEHPTTNLHRAIADYIAIYTFNVTSSANTVYAFTSVFVYCSLLNILF